jgi:putrescine aminotransferase
MSIQPARNTTTWWREADTRHHLHPFTDYKSLSESGGSRIITKADGVWLEDSEGNRILDGMAGLWCVNLGSSTAWPACGASTWATAARSWPRRPTAR